ncbi:alcohol dehydrogenase, zinc containing protein [Enhygromyxa salina]|uniref:Alcohol dehydrogenase, zinc containing protein n=1 Tax=Enhygromyxa salina TaxID=215803 RepID=A0A0C2CUN4_9BACT|nr:NAD(P)-dependent alcohol dehydrogenase [Enhygromyxa salina]KIG13290.1 alcohol dehydrogenase, zinc containing protein [Enhygromyxa salina]
MKAAIQTRFGAPEVIQIQEVERPVAGRGQILVQVHASPVTQGDRRLRAADFPGLSAVIGRLMFGVFRPRNPILGTMFAGRVVAVGEGVTRFGIGDDVFGSCDHSAAAEYLAVAEDGPVANIPTGVEYDEAAAVPYGAVTALVFLRDIARVQPGEKVLIIGASGGVGRFAVQLARHLGARVTGVCSARNMAMVTELGAAQVIDRATTDYTQNGETYDVIFDTSSGDRFRVSKRSLSPKGRYVTVYMNLPVLLQMLVTRIFGGREVRASVAIGTQKLTHDVAELLAKRAIWPVLAKGYPLAQIADAHHAVETGRTAGTVVVAVSEAVRSKPFREAAVAA